MFKVGESVIYGSGGVMIITDIRRERILGEEKEYYVLRAPRAQEGAYTFVPTDNERLVSSMRPLPSREELLAILHSDETASEVEWIKDNRLRADRFKQVMEKGDLKELMAMIRLIYKMELSRQAEGKRGFASDEQMRLRAEKVTASQFSSVLGIPENEVGEFIKKELGEE